MNCFWQPHPSDSGRLTAALRCATASSVPFLVAASRQSAALSNLCQGCGALTSRRYSPDSAVARLAVGLSYLLVLLAVTCCSVPLIHAEDVEADRAFTGTVRLFQGGWSERAEKEFGAFLAAFPNSTNRHEALLLQAQSRYQLKDYDGVITLLQDPVKTGGPWADQYLYWLAEAQSQQERFEAAAKSYAELLTGFTNSTLRLEASYGEAFARFKLGEAARTVELLQSPSGAFQQAAKNSTNETALVRGNFLLAEALFSQRDLPAAEHALTNLVKRSLTPESQWQQQFLLARIEMTDHRGAAALLRATNLVNLATAQSNAVLQARSLTLKAEILQEIDPQAAVEAYEQITKIPGIGAAPSRQATLKLVDLAVAQNRLTNAIERLDTYLKQNPQDSAADLMRLTLGEVYLKQFYALDKTTLATNTLQALAISTNLLFQARGQFDLIIGQLTNSTFLGKAHLNKGWCFWEEAALLNDSAKLTESRNAFQTAVARLPKSLDNATARFKLADTWFLQKDYTNALASYRTVLQEYSSLPEARDKLLDHVLHQIIRADIELKDLSAVQVSLDTLLKEFPKSSWVDRSLLLYGQALAQAGDLPKARAAFADFEQRFPDSPLLPEARLAVARACASQADWPEAIQRYDGWISLYTTNAARPQAEFDRAWCSDQSGDTNAFRLFTNIVEQFPASPYAPMARLWVADYFLNQRSYREADIQYQLLYKSTNAVPLALAKHAQLMAAKAAFFRRDYKSAEEYLKSLVNRFADDTEVGPEAWFMLGDLKLEDASVSMTNKMAKFEDAILHFQRIVSLYPTNRLAPLAIGKIANCHFQLAAQDSGRYQLATNHYLQVINNPLADVTTLDQAEVGLGLVLERMADQQTNRVDLLKDALTHYLNVVYRVRKADGADPYWLIEAAKDAGTLAADRLQYYDQAERLYQSMLERVPTSREVWEKRLATLRQLRVK